MSFLFRNINRCTSSRPSADINKQSVSYALSRLVRLVYMEVGISIFTLLVVSQTAICKYNQQLEPDSEPELEHAVSKSKKHKKSKE